MDTHLPAIITSTPKRIILDHQQAAFDKLVAVGRACFSIQRKTLPIRLRTNTLIIGPSGSGKTHLARAVAEELGAKFLGLAASEWILLGCTARGGAATWPMISEFLNTNHGAEGVVIFLDEIDKVGGGSARGDSTWDNHLRTEAYSLLDLHLPVGLRDEDGNEFNPSPERPQEVLSNRCYIIAAGAFQHLWEHRSRPTLGFAERKPTAEEPVNLTHLLEALPRELTNRFRSDLVALPQLEEGDYRRMLEMVGAGVPHYLRDTFMRLGRLRIPAALACRQGCRFAEELLLDAIIEERHAMRDNAELEPVPPENTEPML